MALPFNGDIFSPADSMKPDSAAGTRDSWRPHHDGEEKRRSQLPVKENGRSADDPAAPIGRVSIDQDCFLLVCCVSVVTSFGLMFLILFFTWTSILLGLTLDADWLLSWRQWLPNFRNSFPFKIKRHTGSCCLQVKLLWRDEAFRWSSEADELH